MIGSAAAREQDWLVGHEAAEQALMSGASAGRLHHAWLLTGPPGIGKATLAFRFARWMLAGQKPGGLSMSASDPLFRRIAAGTHADLMTIACGYDEKRQRFRTEIVADDVRPIGDFLHRTAAEAGWRVVILDDADLLNRSAANALLKLLEEPPPRAVLILVSSVPGRLLPTIRSRCRLLRLEPLDMPEMMTVLARLLPEQDEADRRLLARLGHGSPGRSVAIATEDGIALEGLVREVLADAPPSDGRAYVLADIILRKEQGFATFLTLLADAISGGIRDAARSGRTPASDRVAGVDRTTVWQDLRRIRDETERFNLDKRQALLSSLSLLGGQ